MTCSSLRQESSSGQQQQQAAPPPAPLAAAPPAAQPQQEQPQQVEAAAEQWMPASWLSGWKGTGSMLLSLSAVTGGGLLGARCGCAALCRAVLGCAGHLLPIPHDTPHRPASSAPPQANDTKTATDTPAQTVAGSGFDVKGPESVLQAVAVLGLTVGIHELGHFLAAVTRGIHVTKFSIGFGPTLLKWQVGARGRRFVRAADAGGSGEAPCAAMLCATPTRYRRYSPESSATRVTSFAGQRGGVLAACAAAEFDVLTNTYTCCYGLQGKEVEYSLRALPIGGFVAFPDDDPDSPYEGKSFQHCFWHCFSCFV